MEWTHTAPPVLRAGTGSYVRKTPVRKAVDSGELQERPQGGKTDVPRGEKKRALQRSAKWGVTGDCKSSSKERGSFSPKTS